MSDFELDEILEEIKARSAAGEQPEDFGFTLPTKEASEEAPVTEEPEITEPEAFEPVIDEPAIEDATLEEPEVAEPIIEDAIIEEPEISEPVIEEPVIEEPEIAEPVTQDLPVEEIGALEPEDNIIEVGEAAAAATAAEGAMDILKVAEDAPEPDGELNLMDSAEDIEDEPKKSKKGIVIAIISLLIIAALAAGAYLYFSGKLFPKEAPTTEAALTTTEPASVEFDKGTANPLTGEYGFNKTALTLRPVAVVVENEYSTSAVRPQWGMKEADIVMEGESEFSTRLLFFYADMMSMPEQIGPSRSARPPFIRFSQMWDCVFIHTGLSRSKGNYIGADQVFENENIDHINMLSLAEDGKYFGRDNGRHTAVEHTGYVNGTNMVELLEKHNIRTSLNESRLTRFQFNDEAKPLSETAANKVSFKWSNACPKTGVFTYDEEKQKYTTEDFDSKYGTADLEYETLIFLFDDTEYVIKENYKGSGKSETYCNYDLSGGQGKVLSHGTVVDITWDKKDGKLVMTTADGNELKLNRGKIYIGYGSANHGGTITVE